MIAQFMEAVHRQLAPNGAIRAAINYGNPTIAHPDKLTGQPCGLAVDLVDDMAHRLAVSRTLQVYDGAGQTYEAGLAGGWDIAFLAVEPERCHKLDFTLPFLVLEGSFLVFRDSPLRTVLDLDREGVEIAVAEGSFHDLHLTRKLRRARLVKAKTSAAALELFFARRLDAVAGLATSLAALAAENPGSRVIEGRYAAVQQAIALPKGHAAGLRWLNAFLEEARDSGRINAAKAGCGSEAGRLPEA